VDCAARLFCISRIPTNSLKTFFRSWILRFLQPSHFILDLIHHLWTVERSQTHVAFESSFKVSRLCSSMSEPFHTFVNPFFVFFPRQALHPWAMNSSCVKSGGVFCVKI